MSVVICLVRSREGKLDLSKIKIVGKVKYFNDQKSRLENIPKPHSAVAKVRTPDSVLETNVCTFLGEFLSSATPEQKVFYQYFKENFLSGKCLDLKGNTNYVFLLLYELIRGF